jgi:hypothetical protein
MDHIGSSAPALCKHPVPAGSNYVTIRISNVAQTDFNRVDAAMDGAVDATKGILRWDNDTLRFFAIPIQ